MKRSALLLAITLLVSSLGFAQILGPPDYNVTENPHTKSTAYEKAPSPHLNFEAECPQIEMCVIDYPRPIDNPLLKSSSSVVMTKEQIDIQPLPVIYVKNTSTKPGFSNQYRCTIVDLREGSASSNSSHPRMICTAVDNGISEE